MGVAPLALVWAAALATGRPVGAFTPRTRFRTRTTASDTPRPSAESPPTPQSASTRSRRMPTRPFVCFALRPEIQGKCRLRVRLGVRFHTDGPFDPYNEDCRVKIRVPAWEKC